MKKNSFIKFAIISVLALCSVCIATSLGIAAFNSGNDAKATETNVNISTIVASTSWAASTQTMLAMPPTFTQELLATPTIVPSATVTFTMTFAPTFTAIPTNTLVILATQPQGTQATGGVCSCSGDLYNCTDGTFSTQSQAQLCYDHCISFWV